MRLTLRTLLAWLDDTLPPSEVREIGRQVGESPFAQELVDRIHRVTRQRRLTIPPGSGPDSADANMVAAYLDNELDPDLVAEYEKRCLASDVHLAEVASIHQILSLIGQKAKVPAEARQRMYHLVKGRESAAPPDRRPGTPAEPPQVAEPIQPWASPESPVRPWIERFGPTALVVLLIGVLCWSARLSLSPVATEPAGAIAQSGAEQAEPPAVKKVQAVPAVTPAAPKAEAAETKPAEPADATPAPAPAPDAKLPPPLPYGTVGLAPKPTGVLLRYNPDQRQWEPLTAELPLKPQDRLLSLRPFRNTLTLGPERARVDLIDEAEVWTLSAPPTEAARLNLVQGRVVLHGADSGQPFAIQFAGRNVGVALAPGQIVGVERLNLREPGAATPSGAALRFYAPEGQIELSNDDAKHTLAGPGTVTLAAGEWTGETREAPPNWVTEPKPSTYDEKIGEQFAAAIHPGQPIIRDLVTAMEDPQTDIRRLAIQALRAVGDISFVVPLLSRAGDQVVRRTAIGVLRTHLTQGADSLRELRSELLNYYGPDLAPTIEKLLVGFNAKEARDEATYSTLVKQLTADDVGVRELALNNLMDLTGRDSLDYDPDKPEGRGLRAWEDLRRDKELRPAGVSKNEMGTPKKGETPAAKKGETPAAKKGEAGASRKTEK